MIKLGLVGEGIAQSQSPDLHVRLGAALNETVRYDLVDSRGVEDFDFPDAIDTLRREGYRGTNVTFPFKERAAQLADICGEGVKRVGTANTLLFEAGGLRAENTDYTGFISAYRHSFGERPAGEVLLIGAGGVGRAVACALGEVGATCVHIMERDADRGERLAQDLNAMGITADCVAREQAERKLANWQGVVNCSPIGHLHHPGCPIDTAGLSKRHWVFDAVYVPAHTEFLNAATQAGADVLSGVELFVFQGVDAFRFFTADRLSADRIDAHVISLRQHYIDRLVTSPPSS
ncbi:MULTISPECIES: shikimate dehydrogenase family protein [unclassified Halomonas]|uniref:shikimate dehydrogenase family protein n=1 Tax=unclassified Halomonas TaxID=2609666 RepID=UPI0021E3E74F|nr:MULTISPECIES: shikimate dehydrogenase [unclassified Halomonas]UYF99876.1 shikimate dehydrogenase [Halomonas sp. GD1P12]WNL39036.1 shikimate dehydrogenase [Halomonas sp. PAMB 3232]WNL42386.1 shikimate dehydrogenase [Halomonas sp. PAMB 3264]